MKHKSEPLSSMLFADVSNVEEEEDPQKMKVLMIEETL